MPKLRYKTSPPPPKLPYFYPLQLLETLISSLSHNLPFLECLIFEHKLYEVLRSCPISFNRNHLMTESIVCSLYRGVGYRCVDIPQFAYSFTGWVVCRFW